MKQVKEVTLLLGANIGDKYENILLAKREIEKSIGLIIKESEIMETEPVGFESENIFFNQAIKVNTQLSPVKLLLETQRIEKMLGRKEKTTTVYLDRFIDIDIVYYGSISFYTKFLEIPHKKNAYERDFAISLCGNMK
ncbi:MAG: 2-amino-4-hydroxy-6-hydroxymethyldihydropteridine diphosphokinase [Flavobacteriales bacterium]|nr:2-amino-4-hydroxy-6-hydroxymethyldihydropteridine diphosphokinase [Flavobacteriales bacterium]